ncbi:hypothetical protein [Paraburkholderia bannensis]|uniref:hypothetical protein n=1 Tax=Paraburkholderia bannensis TaxID=765414 RepID=UPI002AB0514D|nr:hypothetical protein [Paraburkholderia bannensis]
MDAPTIQILPPKDGPKQYTVDVRATTLYEHFMAFLSANNPCGFALDEISEVDPDTIGGLMLLVATRDEISEREFKLTAKKVKVQTNRLITHSRALEILSALFGYTDWHDASRNMVRNRGVLVNRRRDRNRINMKIFDLHFGQPR